MKRQNFILSFLLAGTITLSAQNKDTQGADKLFQQFEYVDATKEYLKLVDKGKQSPYIYKQLAEGYYNMFNTAEAIRWYAKVVETPQDAETYYKYAQMLKAEGKYEEANKQMNAFASKAPSDKRAKEFKANPNYLPELLGTPKGYDVKVTDVSSDKTDFGAFLTNDNTLYFVSARSKTRRTDGFKDEPYLDIYSSTRNDDGSLTKAEEVKELNTKWHDGPVTISADGNTMYFSRDSHAEKSYEKDKNLKTKFGQVHLFKATKENGKWSNIVSLPFNSKSYSNSSPSLSKDGKTLYFSSDMPGTLGETDIWKVSINDDGTYGTPENLGPKVNTEAKEQFPFISDDNQLFFSSNGRAGFGGLDIFVIDLAKGTEARNLGKPVNTEKDDFNFTFNTVKNVGFFASNRGGNDDIYQADPVCFVEATTIVTDAKTGAILANAKVTLMDDKKKIVGTKNTSSTGEVTFTLDCNKPYGLQAEKQGYDPGAFQIAATKGGKVETPAALNPIEVVITEKEVILNEILFDYNKSNITPEGAAELDKLVRVMNEHPNMVIMVKAHTDNRGNDKFNMNLSNQRAKSTVQYVVSKGIDASRISGKGYGESEPKVNCKENCTEEEHAINRRSEFLIVKK